MYIIQNALKNVVRNRGRNILLAAITLAIITTTVVTLMISNTSDRIIDEYRALFGTEVTISRNLERFIEMRNRGEAERGITITHEQYIAFAQSDLLHHSVLMNTAMVNSETVTAVGQTDAVMGGGGFVTPPTMMLQGDNWVDFANGYRLVVNGRMPEQAGEAIISTELAELNDISVGDTMRLYGVVMEQAAAFASPTIYNLTVTGIYFSEDEVNDGSIAWGGTITNRHNEILTVFDTIDNGSAGTSLIATYFLRNPSYLEAFDQELREKGLHPLFDVSTDIETYNAIVGPVEGMRDIITTFMIIVLVLGAIILILLSSIAIRERKYEIGVLRAMGMKKAKVALGLWFEMVFITIFCLIIGIGAGSIIAQPVSNTLLAQQIENAQRLQEMGGGFFTMQIGEQSRTVDTTPIDEVIVSIGVDTMLQIMLISLLLASVTGFGAIIRITKYEPIKILMERN